MPLHSPSQASQSKLPIPDFAVELSGLEKTYKCNKRSGPKHALNGIDLQIPLGSVF